MNRAEGGVVDLRFALDSDLGPIMQAHSRVFGTRSDAMYRANWKQQTHLEDILLAVDNQGAARKIIGTAMYYRMSLCLPGRRQVAVAGGGMTLVEPTHRRRGIFREMYSELLRLAQSRGYPVLVGMPSQGTIYRRFGRGPATQAQSITIDRRRANLCVPTKIPHTIDSCDSTEAMRIVPARYAAYAATTPGAVSRSGTWWDLYFADEGFRGVDQSERFYFVHPDGYAAYRIQQGPGHAAVKVDEVCAATDQAHSDLWAAILGLEAFDTVTAEISPSDPLALKLVDIRAVRVTNLRDVMWLRILDVSAALSAREYASDGQLVIRVDDPIALSGGTFRLTVYGGIACCERADADPELLLSLDDLSSLYLGGFDVHQLLRAGRLHAVNPKALAVAESVFFCAERPFCSTYF